MSARNGQAHGLGRAWRKLRGTPAVVTPESPPEPSTEPLAAPKPEPRERDILDVIDEEVALITPEHIEKRLQETLRRVGAAPPAPPAGRCPRCTYPVGSIGCRNTHGGGG